MESTFATMSFVPALSIGRNLFDGRHITTGSSAFLKWYGAYGEGWALYCESLGKELGLYKNPYQHMGALGDEIHRAIRLVVDVAIHERAWPVSGKLLMMENEAIDEGATAENRTLHGRIQGALSYKIGAVQKYGSFVIDTPNNWASTFNIGEFRKQVLKSGCASPLQYGRKLDKWAEKR